MTDFFFFPISLYLSSLPLCAFPPSVSEFLFVESGENEGLLKWMDTDVHRYPGYPPLLL